MNTIIRDANKDDMRDVAQINITCVPDGTRAKWGEWLTAEFFSYYLEENHLFIVAEADGRIVGFVMGFWKGSNARELFETKYSKEIKAKICNSQKKAFITEPKTKKNVINQKIEDNFSSVMYSLCVLPDYSGLGLGKKLAEEYWNKIRSLGGQSICLSTARENLAARHIYESTGMKKIHEDNVLVWYSKGV